MINQNESVAEPAGKDNISGSTGWVTLATHGLLGTSKSSLWCMVKYAVGGETELSPTVGGGTDSGLTYWEVAGLSQEVDAIVHTDNKATVKTIATPGMTTGDES